MGTSHGGPFQVLHLNEMMIYDPQTFSAIEPLK